MRGNDRLDASGIDLGRRRFLAGLGSATVGSIASSGAAVGSAAGTVSGANGGSSDTAAARQTSVAEPASTTTSGQKHLDPITEGLVSRYRFEGSLTDSFGEFDLTASDPSFANGIEGRQALSVTASPSNNPSGPTADITPETALTATMWINSNEGSSSSFDDGFLLKFEDPDGGGIGFVLDSNNTPFVFTAGGNTLDTSRNVSVDATTGGWRHVAFVWEQQRRVVSVYVDGSLIYEVTSYDDRNDMTDVRLYVGSNQNTNKIHEAVYDDLRVYHRALDASEIATVASPSETGPAAVYDLDDDGEVDLDEVNEVIADFERGEVGIGLVNDVIAAFESGSGWDSVGG